MASSLIQPLKTQPLKPKNSSFLERKYAPYFFVAPFFITFLIFGAFPIFFSLYLSFQKWRQTSGLGEMKYNGLENYQFILTRDPWFWKAVLNTLILGVYGLLIQPLALALSVAIHLSLKRVKSYVTAMYFLPYITSTVAIALVFGMVFSKNAGLLNSARDLLNHVPLLNLIVPDQNQDWLGNPATIKPAIALVVAWRFLGWNTILYLSRLQSIPIELYEAARVDGASTWGQFWFITLPQLKTMMFLTITLTIIGQMQLFDEPFMLAGGEGGLNQSGLTVSVYMYTTAFKFGEAGTGAAMAWILFAFIVLMNLANNKLFGADARARGD